MKITIAKEAAFNKQMTKIEQSLRSSEEQATHKAIGDAREQFAFKRKWGEEVTEGEIETILNRVATSVVAVQKVVAAIPEPDGAASATVIAGMSNTDPAPASVTSEPPEEIPELPMKLTI